MLLQSLGFKALASTSAGFAWTLGRPDYGLRRDDALTHLSAPVGAVDLPVNADYENAFADAPDGVAANVAAAVATGTPRGAACSSPRVRRSMSVRAAWTSPGAGRP